MSASCIHDEVKVIDKIQDRDGDPDHEVYENYPESEEFNDVLSIFYLTLKFDNICLKVTFPAKSITLYSSRAFCLMKVSSQSDETLLLAKKIQLVI